jgi:Tripartite tricarboxylate transporter family receptor
MLASTLPLLIQKPRNVQPVAPCLERHSDVETARPLATHLADTLGQKVIVENKGGAGGGIGHAYVARAEPHGWVDGAEFRWTREVVAA